MENVIFKMRENWLDSVKGILIILVVLGHAIQNTIPDCNDSHLWNYIYSFHMAAFMMVSGYANSKDINPCKTIWKRAINLLLPFIVWSIVMYRGDVSNFGSVLLHPDFTFWFLWVLFFIFSIMTLFRQFSRLIRINEEIVTAIVAIILMGSMIITEFRLFGYQFIAYYFIFYSLGFYWKKYKQQILPYYKPLAISTFVVWAIGAYFWKMHELPFFLHNVPAIPTGVLLYAYRGFIALIGCIAVMTSGELLLSKMNIKTLLFIGKLTMGVYVIHVALPFNILKYINFDINCAITINWIVRLLYSVLLSWLLMKNKWTALVFMGKPIKK